MASESKHHADGAGQPSSTEQRATAFVFGELDREQATAFMKELDASPSLQSLVDSIRDAVGAVQAEFEQDAAPVNQADRRRILAAIHHPSADPPPVVPAPADDGSWNWALALAVAATLLLACGLTLPGLNRVINANTETNDLKQRVQRIEELNRELLEANRLLNRRVASLQNGRPIRSEGSAMNVPRGSDLAGLKPGEAVTGVDDAEIGTLADVNSDPADEMPSRGATETELAGGPDHSRGSVAGSPESFAVDDPQARTDGAESNGTRGEAASGNGEPPVIAEAVSPGRVEQADDFRSDPVQNSGEEKIDRESIAGSLPNRTQPLLGQVWPGGRNPTQDRRRERNETPLEAVAEGIEREGKISEDAIVDMMDETASDSAITRLAMPSFPENHGVWRKPNQFHSVIDSPLSSVPFAAAGHSYDALIDQVLRQKRLPKPDSVRIEQWINQFDYRYPSPTGGQRFAASIDVAACPWDPDHRLARIGIQAKKAASDRPAANLVFLVDVSGSMNRPSKLPQVVKGIRTLTDHLGENDSIAIVVYAGASGVVLDSTAGDRKKTIADALRRLKAGGPASADQGIQLAYRIAREHLIQDGINRVVLCSDGDMDFGVQSADELFDLAKTEAGKGVRLTVLRFGADRKSEDRMDEIAAKADGEFIVIDNGRQARRVFLGQIQTSLETIARDVQVRVEFNPAEVEAYRLIGYDDWVLTANTLEQDEIRSQPILSGDNVTALYEIIPRDHAGDAEGAPARSPVDELKYQQTLHLREAASSGEMLTVGLMYHIPDETRPQRIEFAVTDDGKRFDQADRDFHFSAAVAAFGMLLRHSPRSGAATLALAEELAVAGADGDRSGYRQAFVSLIQQARKLSGK